MEGKGRYLGGGEESYGFLPETFARDKDAVSSIPMMCEIAAWAKEKGMTMNEMLIDLYLNYGYSKERGISVVRKGKSGAEEIVAMMKNFRENPQQEIAGSPVVLIKDFLKLEELDVKTGKITKIDMPMCCSTTLRMALRFLFAHRALSPRLSSTSRFTTSWRALSSMMPRTTGPKPRSTRSVKTWA